MSGSIGTFFKPGQTVTADELNAFGLAIFSQVENITQGVAALTGDVMGINNAGTIDCDLSSTGVAAGTYNSVQVHTDGRVYAGTISAGNVSGPGSSTTGHVATFANNTGTVLADGGALGSMATQGSNAVHITGGTIAVATATVIGLLNAGTIELGGGTPFSDLNSAQLGVSGGNLGFITGPTIQATNSIAPVVISNGLTAFPPAYAAASFRVAGTGAAGAQFDSFGGFSQILLVRADGSQASPTGLLAGEVIGQTVFHGYDGAAYSATGAANYQVSALNNWGTTDHSTYHRWSATNSGAVTPFERMRLTGGHLLIGTTTDDAISFLQVSGPAKGTYLAEGVGNNLTTTGSTQAGALALTNGLNVLGTVAVNSGAFLPAIGTLVPIGAFLEVFNTTVTKAQIYGTSPQTIDGVATATGVPLSGGNRCRYFANSGSTWISAQLGSISA